MDEGLRQRADALLEQMGPNETTPPQRHAPGRASALTPMEADEIRWRYVAQGQNISQIARETGRSREAVRNIVKDQETTALQEELQQMKRARAKQILAGATDTASELWVESMRSRRSGGITSRCRIC